VVIGDRRTRTLYTLCMLLPYLGAIAIATIAPVAGLTILAVPLAILPARQVLQGAVGRDLIAVLGQTGRFQLGFGLLLTVGLTVRI
jgi:1,4-dihydroxy-2-naphthoate octaprenyltransferase